jgi:uncharacterized protein involved in exopolysaccharide biosynthesis
MSQNNHTPASHNPYHDDSPLFGLPSVDFREVLSLYLRKWWVIVICVAFAALAASYYLYRQPKLFESRAVLFVGQEKERVVAIQSVMPMNSATSPSSRRWSRVSPRER